VIVKDRFRDVDILTRFYPSPGTKTLFGMLSACMCVYVHIVTYEPFL
jgi:hypothetical protein